VQGWTAKIAATFRSFERAARRTFHRKIRATPFPDRNGGVPYNASGVAQVGPHRFVFIDNHDADAFFEFALHTDAEDIQRIRRRNLVGVDETQLSDPEGLTRVEVNGETFVITASSLSVAGGSRERRVHDGLVRVRYTADGDLRAEAMPGFRTWLLSHEPFLSEAGELEPDAGGLNIEGLAWDPRASTLVFGLRGPASPGRIGVIRVPVDAGVHTWTTAALKEPTVLLARVPQSSATQGIRDICYDDRAGEFLILLGRSLSRGDEPFQLCAWDGRSDSVRLVDVKFHRSMKPEGITAFASGDEQKVLIVDDGGGYAVLAYGRTGLR
jgi:hypothetical protein